MPKILIFASEARSLVVFRWQLLKDLKRAGHEVIAVAPNQDPQTTEQLTGMGIHYRVVAFNRTGINPINDLRLLAMMSRLMQEIRPDIVFNYTIKPVIYGSLAAYFTGVPKIYSMVTGLGYIYSGQSFKQLALQAITKRLYRWSLASNQVVFFQNNDDQQLFRQARILQATSRSVLLAGSGIDSSQFVPVPLPQAPVFLLIARLIWEKGIQQFAEAAQQLKTRYPQVRFCVIGPIEQSPSAIPEAQIRHWHEQGIFEYLGATRDVRPYLAQASVFVLPSFYREGVPRTILEAMAMGRAIITTDAPGCRETVEKERNGFLVPIKDSLSLANAMERLIQDPDLLSRMGHESRIMAEERYDIHKVNGVILTSMGVQHEAVA